MKAFEIHTFMGGKWKIDSVFDDRDLAVFEAQRMESSKRYAGVRVVEENFDEHTQQTATRTIYKGTCVDQPATPEVPRKQAAAVRPVRGGAAKGATPRRTARAQPAPKSGSSNTALVFLLGAIVVVGAGILIGLRYFAVQG
jgi:hypothetical protein